VKIRFLIALSCAAAPWLCADSLDAVLARMDANAKTFKSAAADIKQTEYTAILKDSTEEFGVLKIKRDNKGVMALLDYTKPDKHASLIKDKKAWVYTPKAVSASLYDLGKYTTSVDQYVLLAFGSSGAELRKNYDVKPGGTETIGSKPTTRLELTPKSDEVKKMFAKIELWIPDGEAYAVRLKATAPSDNYYQFDYSNIAKNPGLADSVFDLHMPKNVKIVKPQ
jgi:outer membrane lipoprotein-sorting protein